MLSALPSLLLYAAPVGCSSDDEGGPDAGQGSRGQQGAGVDAQPLGPVLPDDTPRTMCIKQTLEMVRARGGMLIGPHGAMLSLLVGLPP